MNEKTLDLTGYRFGRLTILIEAERRGYARYWLCKCDCENEVEVYMSNLKHGKTQSCGCLQRERVTNKHSTKHIGERFGSLTVIKRTEKGYKNNPSKWLCKCDCGNTSVVFTSNLTRGYTKSCGRCRKGGGKSMHIANTRRKCAADDCGEEFTPKSYQQIYCSDQCRWRDNKKKRTKERYELGLCPQCGGKMTESSTSYCTKCQEYFKDNYYKNKIEKDD